MTTEDPSALMAGFPSQQRVNHENQLYGPFNRWAFQHELQLNRTADVWRGTGPVAPLERNLRDLSGVTYVNGRGERLASTPWSRPATPTASSCCIEARSSSSAI